MFLVRSKLKLAINFLFPKTNYSRAACMILLVSIRFLSPLKCFFKLSMMFIVFKPGTPRSFISFVPIYFSLNVFVLYCGVLIVLVGLGRFSIII